VTSIAQGTCEPRFEPVRDALADLVASGEDVGASAAVVHEGKLVADVWAGHADAEKTTPWERDTIVNVWSTTKTMTNLSALVLADRGEIDLDAPVADHWPEFKANGKEGVLVRHLLAHTAGLPSWRTPIAVEDLYDWDKVCSLLAEDEPWWEPGTASGYHALTQGNLVGEVIRRATGKTVGTWFAENLAAPLGADFHIGTPAKCDDRVAKVIPPPSLAEQISALGLDPESIAMRAFGNPVLDATKSWDVDWRRAEIPAAGGHGNARSVAIVQSIVSGLGETHGQRFLSEAGVERIFEEQSYSTDLVLTVPIRLGIGYGLASKEIPFPSPRTCFWGGWGGSLVLNDLENHLTIAYVMNKMGEGTLGDLRGAMIVAGAYASLAG
jgi:CubicO group peptidase (beta-lactamase class C family)